MIINRDKERIKRTNEIFTPTILVNQILDQFPKEAFMSVDETFCDPTCGDGEFLVELLKRKFAGGLSAKDAIDSTYGVDYMEDNVKLCKKRIRKILTDKLREEGEEIGSTIYDIINRNIIYSDFFEWDFENWKKRVTHDEQVKDLLGNYEK